MENPASAVVEPQQKLLTSQKSKKKPKVKKTGKDSASNLPSDIVTGVLKNGENDDEVNAGPAVAANGLCAKLELLHIAGDGLQMNGIGEKCSGQVDTQATNGHHTLAAYNANKGTCTSITNIQHQQISQVSMGLGAGKKTKSKSNKQKSKDASFDCDEATKQTNSTSNGKMTVLVNKQTSRASKKSLEEINETAETVAAVQLENGFHGRVDGHCKKVRQNASLVNNSRQQREKCSTIPTIKNFNTTIATKVASDADGVNMEMAAVSMTDICLQDTTKSAPTIAADHITTNVNHPIANNTSKNTAQQDEQNAVAPVTNANCNMLAIGDSPLNPAVTTPAMDLSNVHIEYKEYESELQMHDIMRLIQAELSEPYSIYTYRYFIYNWPKLCFLAAHGSEYVGAIVCKLDMHMNVRRGYIAMLAVRKEYRKLKIGTTLVQKAIEAMLTDNADEVVLETEMRNVPALRLYENLGFVRDKRLFRYYLNGVDALRLKLWFR